MKIFPTNSHIKGCIARDALSSPTSKKIPLSIGTEILNVSTIFKSIVDSPYDLWYKHFRCTKDNIEYTQLTDPHGFEAKSAIQFGVEALPASFLFDPNGKLIAINPTEKEIKQQLNHNKK